MHCERPTVTRPLHLDRNGPVRRVRITSSALQLALVVLIIEVLVQTALPLACHPQDDSQRYRIWVHTLGERIRVAWNGVGHGYGRAIGILVGA